MIRYGKTEPLLANCISKLLKQMSFSKLITIAIGFTSLSEFFTAAWPWQRERLDTFEGQFHWWIFNETFFALFPPLLCFIIKTNFAVTGSVIRWWNKKLPNFPPQNCPKNDSDIIRNSPKSNRNNWVTFVRQFLTKYCHTGNRTCGQYYKTLYNCKLLC